MRCQRCGRDNLDTARFCTACGANLTVADPGGATVDQPTTVAPVIAPTPPPATRQQPSRAATATSEPRFDAKTLGLAAAAVVAVIGIALVVFALVRDDGSKEAGPKVKTTTPKSTTSPPPPAPLQTTDTTAPPATDPPTTAAPVTAPPSTVSAGPSPIVELKPNHYPSASTTQGQQTDNCGEATHFDATNAFDGHLDTAWESSGDNTNGDSNPSLTLYFDRPVTVSHIDIVAGYKKTDPCPGSTFVDRWFQLRHITGIRYEFDGGQSMAITTDPTNENYTGTDIPEYRTTSLTIVVTSWDEPGGSIAGADTSHGFWDPGATLQRVAISEVKVTGSTS